MSLLQDARVAIRRVHRTPLFSFTVAGTLALGIAATTAMYTVVDGVLLKPLPFRDPASLVRVTADLSGVNLRDIGMSQPELDDYARRSGIFESIAGIWPISANVTGSDRPERVEVLLASPNYFDLLGARAALGRTFNDGDEVSGIATVAVISDALWRRGFGGDPGVLGRNVRIDEDVYEIIGVMPPSFRHPSLTLETDVEVWAPSGWRSAPFAPPAYSARFVPSAIGRLAPGVSIEAARTRLERFGADLAREHPDDYPARLGWVPRSVPLAGDLVARVRAVLLVVMGAIGCVLLIAISNISNLWLARATAREREIAVQRALGANRWRIARSLLLEAMVLAAVGGALGFLLSLWGVDALLRLVPDRLPRMTDIAVDGRVFLFACSVSVVAGLLVAAAPALQSARTNVIDRLKEAGRVGHSGSRARGIRNALVVAQVAVAIVLLAGAGLLVRSLRNLQVVETGLQTDKLQTARLWLPQPNDPKTGPFFDPAKRVVLMRGILDRLAGTPGIVHAGMATALPLTNDTGTASFAAEGWPADRRDFATAIPVSVTPGYFPALGMRLVSGRLLNDDDGERAPRAVVINETLAKTYFGGENPVGRRFRFVGRRGQVAPNARWITIVGIVRDAKEDGLDAPVRPQIYQSLWQASNLSLVIVAQGPTEVPGADLIRRAVQDTNPNLPLYAPRSGKDLLALGLAQRRFGTRLINAFAAVALLLSAFGLHGVIAYGVRQRTHEIGVRVALGATASRVIALVMTQAARLTLVGIAIGVVGALILSRAMTSLLFEVSAADPLTLIVVVVLLAVVAALATFAAAQRAARIDPAVALRSE